METTDKMNLELYDSIVSIDSYDDYMMSGTMYHSYRKDGIHFHCLWQMVCILEDIFDEMDYPQKNMDIRSFLETKKVTKISREQFRNEYYGRLTEKNYRRGLLATFFIQIMFRQNASWQGTICWVDQGQTKHFRSIFELCKLIESTLNGGEHEDRKS